MKGPWPDHLAALDPWWPCIRCLRSVDSFGSKRRVRCARAILLFVAKRLTIEGGERSPVPLGLYLRWK